MTRDVTILKVVAFGN